MPAASPQNTRKKQVKRKKVIRPAKPTNTAQTYVSQGKAVDRAANTQKARVRRRQAEVKDTKSNSEFRRAKSYKKTSEFKKNKAFAGYKAYTYAKKRGRGSAVIKRQAAEGDAESAAIAAPVLRVLDQTTRPVHAVMGAARKDVQEFKKHGPVGLVGHGSLKEAGKGIRNKTRYTGSDVLKEAGVKNKTVRGVAGFVSDVVLDPLTYATGGTSSLSKHAGEKAASQAERKAAKAGLSESQVKRFGERARAQAEKAAPEGRRVTVKAGGLKGSVKAPKLRAPQKVKDVVADVNPNAAPAGVKKATSDAAIRATRAARAKTGQGERDAARVATGVKKQIGEDNYSRVIDALEAGKVKSLPEELRPHAIAIRSTFRHANRLRKQAGIPGGERKNYVPHLLTEETKAVEGKVAQGVGKRVVRPSSSKARKDQRSLKQLREEKPGAYREDLHAVTALRMAEGTRSAAQADLNRSLAELGRPVRRGQAIELEKGEAVFHIKGSDLRKVDDAEAARAARPLTMNKRGTKVKGANKKGGRYVVLHEDVVKRAMEGANPQLQGPGIVHAFDKATGGFKRIALATPGFHVRNLIGDTAQAYIKQPGHKLPGNLNRSRQVLKELDRQQIARERLERPKPSGKTLKTGKYGHVPLEDVAHKLVEAGAARSGYTARELRELSQSGGVKQGGKVRQTMRKGRKAVGSTRSAEFSKRLLLNREDLPRLATAIHALQNGATWEEAAARVAETHFDYGHLTSFERNVARRILPFYTWSARNIPFTAKNVIARPGKYANIQKIREEAAKASGADEQTPQTQEMYAQLEKAGVKLPKGWEKVLSEWEQRNAGVPVSYKGQKFTVSAGLPLQDLSEFPGAAGAGQAQEYYQKLMSLVNPIIKDPVEYFENHSFFFRDEIEREHSPLVAAPSYVKAFPKSLRTKLGITDQYVDKKSGKKTWGWPGKLDYLAKAVPGTPNYLQQLSTGGTDRRGKTTGGKALAFAGIKSVPIDPAKNAVNLAYGRLEEIARAKSKLNQQGIGSARSGKRETPEYRKLLDQEKILRQIAFQGKAEQGYKVMPTQGGPKKIRASGATGWSDSGSQGTWGDQSSQGTWGG